MIVVKILGFIILAYLFAKGDGVEKEREIKALEDKLKKKDKYLQDLREKHFEEKKLLVNTIKELRGERNTRI
jgi:hypothetical protein